MILRILTEFSRILVGSLFIVSGLIKSNDILGFVYKLEEYFEPGALNLTSLTEYALPLAIFIVIGEILLGVAMLVGAMPKLTAVLTLIMMLFFTWLTYYTSTCDPNGVVTIIDEAGVAQEITKQCVLECGCFGNAIPLTPWQSFIKDVVILVLFVPFFISAFMGRVKLNTSTENKYVMPASLVIVSLFSYLMLDWLFPILFTGICLLVAVAIARRVKSKFVELYIAAAVLVICGLFQYQAYAHLPLKDYRPYAIGENLIENRKSAEELGLKAPQYAYPYSFRNIQTGEDSIIWSNDYMKIYKEEWFKTRFEKHDETFKAESVMIEDGYEAKIQDLNPTSFDDGEEVLEEILSDPGYTLVFVSKDLSLVESHQVEGLKELSDQMIAAGHQVYGWTATDYDTAMNFKEAEGLSFEFCEMDGIESKIIIRSNPGIVLLKNAVVLDKWAWRDLPSFEEVQEDFLK